MSEPVLNPSPEPAQSEGVANRSSSSPTVFRGPNGIRAGWRVLIFLAIVAALAAAVNLVVWLVLHFFLHGPPQLQIASSLSPITAVLSDGAILLFTGLAALIMSRIEHRKWGEYGLPVRFAFRQHFWLGSFAGFLAISSSLFAIFLFHGF